MISALVKQAMLITQAIKHTIGTEESIKGQQVNGFHSFTISPVLILYLLNQAAIFDFGVKG